MTGKHRKTENPGDPIWPIDDPQMRTGESKHAKEPSDRGVPMQKGAKELIELAKRYNFELDRVTKNRHYQFRHAQTGNIVLASASGDIRAIKNVEALMKKANDESKK